MVMLVMWDLDLRLVFIVVGFGGLFHVERRTLILGFIDGDFAGLGLAGGLAAGFGGGVAGAGEDLVVGLGGLDLVAAGGALAVVEGVVGAGLREGLEGFGDGGGFAGCFALEG